MRAAWLIFAAIALTAHGQSAARIDSEVQRPTIQVDFSNPGLAPPQWTLTIHPDGSGHFRSKMAKTPPGGLKEIEAPSLDQDIQVSPQFAGRVFNVAQTHNWFNEKCESHLKVAFQGWKTFTFSGPAGTGGTCTFNYSKDKEIQALGDSMQAVAQTILEGARLQTLLQHDPLGLDQEMEYLTEAVGDGRAQQVCAIRDILERLVQDDSVLERVRKRARALLALGST
jgi:hypothetical protein